jgi:uncharacterized protein YegP (UPF0339 family)
MKQAMHICNKEKNSEQHPNLHADGKCILKSQIYTVQKNAAIKQNKKNSEASVSEQIIPPRLPLVGEVSGNVWGWWAVIWVFYSGVATFSFK